MIKKAASRGICYEWQISLDESRLTSDSGRELGENTRDDYHGALERGKPGSYPRQKAASKSGR